MQHVRGLTAAALLPVLLLGAYPAGTQATGRVVGRITDTVGNALPGAVVTLRREEADSLRRSTRSGGTGGFEFTALPAGAYTLSAERAGYRRGERRVEVGAGERQSVVLRLPRTRE